jgi:uncharacterized protein (DUF58 family)
MMVPRSRLLWWVAAVALPFSLVAAVVPAAAGLSFGLIGVLALAALADAISGRRTLAGIGVSFPEVVRASLNRETRIEIRIHNPTQKARRLRLAPAFPAELGPVEPALEIALPAGSEWSRLSWACQPTTRGRNRIKTSFVEAASPLGFWGMRRQLSTPAEIRVYPNLLTERRNLASLFLSRGNYGAFARRQIGKGRDFEQLREYIPGDGYDEVHWKATAKRGRPVTKVFQIERTQEVYVIVDASRLSGRTQVVAQPLRPTAGRGARSTGETSETTVLERFVTAALVLGLAAEQQGDLFGLLTFSDRVGTFLRARNGNAHYSACRDALYTLQPAGVAPDFDEVSTFIRLRLRRRALLFFLTSLDDPLLAASFTSNMDLICRQHLVIVGMIQPPGVAPLFASADVHQTDDLYRQLGGHLLWQKLRELEKVLKRRGVRFSLLPDERMCGNLVSQYMDVKQRQLL